MSTLTIDARVKWAAITDWISKADWLAISTAVLALATSILAGVTWRGVRENKDLIRATKREADLLWENAGPYLIPENVDGVGDSLMTGGRMKVSSAAGTIPARAVKAWFGSAG